MCTEAGSAAPLRSQGGGRRAGFKELQNMKRTILLLVFWLLLCTTIRTGAWFVSAPPDSVVYTTILIVGCTCYLLGSIYGAWLE